MKYNLAKPNRPRLNFKNTWTRKMSCRKNWTKCKKNIIRSIAALLCRSLTTDLTREAEVWVIYRIRHLSNRGSIIDSQVTSCCMSSSLKSRGEPECLHIGCRAHSQFRNPPQKDKGQINRLQRESAKLHSHHIIQDLGKVIIMLTSLIILRRISTLIFETKTWICLFKWPTNNIFNHHNTKTSWWQTRKWCPLSTLSPLIKGRGAHIEKILTQSIRVAKVEVQHLIPIIMGRILVHRNLGNISWPRLKKLWAIMVNLNRL